MSLSQFLIVNIPSALLATIVVLAAMGAALAGALISRRIVPHHKLRGHNDVAGFLFGTIGVIYAVLMAFCTIAVWEDYKDAQSTAESEAVYLESVYRNVGAFPEQPRLRIQGLLRRYVHEIITDEWKTMGERGEPSETVQQVEEELWAAFIQFEPQTAREQLFAAEAVGKFDEACEMRRTRLNCSREGVDGLVWAVLIVCGILTVVFSFFFGIENRRAQILMTSCLAVIIGLILFTILEYQYPFSGDLSIAPEALEQLPLADGSGAP